MPFLKVVPALKVQMSVWGVQVGPYGFSAVRVSLVLPGHGQARRSSGSLILIHTRHSLDRVNGRQSSSNSHLVQP